MAYQPTILNGETVFRNEVFQTGLMSQLLDGIRNRIEPPAPIDKDLYELPAEEAKDIKTAPANLEAALEALEADHDFLLEGGVFTEDLIQAWIDYKRKNELEPLSLIPHPLEYQLYYGV